MPFAASSGVRSTDGGPIVGSFSATPTGLHDSNMRASAHDDLPPASAPSSVPSQGGRRRESIGGQLRRLDSSTVAAASGSHFHSRINNGQALPSSRISTSPRPIPSSMGAGAGVGFEPSSFSTSFGAAGEALTSKSLASLGSSLAANGKGSAANGLSSSTVASGLPATSTPTTTAAGAPKSIGHTHFGQECYGPQPGDPTALNPPPGAMLSAKDINSGQGKSNGNGTADDFKDPAARGGGVSGRRASISSTMTDDSEVTGKALSQSYSGGAHSMLHKCESCSKVYRHPSCLIKHRWEHTVYWKEASKFLMSKHQQVQLLEAAAILVGMDCNARSLPEEKALWPAAVSPPSSGLLGSDKINFEKLLAQKNKKPDGRNASASPVAHRSSSASLSPLYGFTNLQIDRRAGGNIGGSSNNGEGIGRDESSMMTTSNNGDVQHLALDESAERSRRSESAETDDERDDDDDDDDDGEGDESMTGSTTISTGSPSREAEERERERYGLSAGGDVLAEMEMEGVE